MQVLFEDTKRKYQSQWILSSYNKNSEIFFPDSLDQNVQQGVYETTSVPLFETSNQVLWNVGKTRKFYDSIDSNMHSSFYQQHGEDLAECDSLEKRLSGPSHK